MACKCSRARCARPVPSEYWPAANVSGNWTNVAMGPWPAKQSSVASYRPAANPADVAAALQTRHICSRRHAGQRLPLRAQTGSSACRFDRANESAAPMPLHSRQARVNRRINREHGESCGRESQGIHAWFP